MHYCSKCGAKIDITTGFCPHCANAVNKITTYCGNCGSAIENNTNICPHCGNYAEAPKKKSSLKTAAKILMIISCVNQGIILFFSLITLSIGSFFDSELLAQCIIGLGALWTIPMTVHYCNSIKYNNEVSVGFKICTLIFANPVAGILMLYDKD